MIRTGFSAIAIVALLVANLSPIRGDDKSRPTAARRKVLVELYTSQGCDSCPPASKLMGQLKELGYGPDRIIPINFHVDYFNDPWVDPFSRQEYSRREMAYNDVLKRDDLYFTPMLMIDGRTPFLGSNRQKILPALDKALKEPLGLALDLKLTGSESSKTLTVSLSEPAASTIGRPLLIGVAITEDPISTKVTSGENAGKTLVEHDTVRFFSYKNTRLERSGTEKVEFNLDLPGDAVAARLRVAVFAQDQKNGKVYQADVVPWIPTEKSR
jgi:hypothetical protein